jgi:hypothetical protein
LLFVRELLLLLMLLVLAVSLLAPHIEAVTYQWIGVNVVNVVALFTLDEAVRG